MSISKEKLIDMYEKMLSIRRFEEESRVQLGKGLVFMATHCYDGQEAVATGVCACLDDSDYITSTHRGHGHIIAKGGEEKYMMAELMGKATGYCKGKCGSMHIADASKGVLGANGIVGAGTTIAVGAALSMQYQGKDRVCACFFGDDATNIGTFHEAMNLAAVWNLPVIFVCENNGYGISTPQSKHMKLQNIADRAAAYGIEGVIVDGNDVVAVYNAAAKAVEKARSNGGPTFIECKTYRFRGHFEGDPTPYRTKEELDSWLAKDPIPRMEAYLLENKIAAQDEIDAIKAAVDKKMADAVEFALNSPNATAESAVEDIYTDIVEEVRVR